MNWQKILFPVLAAVLLAAGWQISGWGGVALVAGILVMWMLLHVRRMIQVLKRATDRPMGYVDSAVMLNAKLKRGATLLHVMAMTRALGEPLSPADQQPEIFRWTDEGQSHVTAEFADGKLAKWTLYRPPAPDEAAAPPAP